MNFLIIGAKGFIGGHCVSFFLAKGYKVWQADIIDSHESNYFKLTSTNSNYSKLFKETIFDVCINASGSAHVGFSFENPTKDFELNVVNVQKILIAIRDFNKECKFINFSSAAVYGNPKTLPIKEDSLTKPLSPYGFHKLQSELLLIEYYKFFNLKTCSLRIFSAYGPGLKKQLFWDLYKKSNSESTIALFGTGQETRDFIYIDDLLLVIDLVIKNSDFKGELYNAANGNEITISEAVSIFVKEYCPDKRVVFNLENKIGDPLNWKADINKIEEIGYISKTSFSSGIKKYIKWLKENE